MPKVFVKYWKGTMQFEGKATTYVGALRLAHRNQNKYPPRFYDSNGEEVFDDGNGLAYEGDGERKYLVM